VLLQKSCFQLLLKDIDISQGSVVTHLSCGRIFSDSIITNFLLIMTVKKFENWSIYDEVIRCTKSDILGPPCIQANGRGRKQPHDKVFDIFKDLKFFFLSDGYICSIIFCFLSNNM